ncbi:unnamed protein product [Urochloa decumbens]|uniref:Protein FAR1-RELATED SEQUENCE n=1 Tax=Urochloa decumbens TaxID=240449 RepID=A0ABC9B726_9POAL
MTRAIRNKLKDTKHRWCRWHVLKDAKTHLGFAYSKHSSFKKEFNELVTYERDAASFEKTWKALEIKYKLTKNTYLQILYRYRHRWATPYFMDVFCGGMTSTQRSESANHMVKALIQKAASMHLFVSKFRELQADRKYEEGKAAFVTKQKNRKLRTNEPLEEHANAVYTRGMYERFNYHMHQSGKYKIKEKISQTEFIVIYNKMKNEEEAFKFHVTLHESEYIHCSCGMFEHMGLICRHAIKVLLHLDKAEIPRRNILGRWTKAWDGCDPQNQVHAMDICSEEDKRRMIINKALQLANKRSRLSNYEFEQAMQVLTTVDQNNERGAEKKLAPQQQLLLSNDQIPTSCPPSTYKGGRPPNTGLKSWLASTKKQTMTSSPQPTELVCDWPYEENPPTRKKRSISEVGRL